MPKNQESEQLLKTNTITLQKAEYFSGPLPHPNILEKYNQILPGAAERIMVTFEKQTIHRHKIENIIIWSDSIKSLAGIAFAFVIAMATILGGIYTALEAHPFLGGSLSFTGLSLIVGIFITNKYFTPMNKK
jgi:hypothetical protein